MQRRAGAVVDNDLRTGQFDDDAPRQVPVGRNDTNSLAAMQGIKAGEGYGSGLFLFAMCRCNRDVRQRFINPGLVEALPRQMPVSRLDRRIECPAHNLRAQTVGGRGEFFDMFGTGANAP